MGGKSRGKEKFDSQVGVAKSDSLDKNEWYKYMGRINTKMDWRRE